MISRVFDAILYGGVGKEWYQTVKPDIVKTNRRMVSRLSLVASIVITMMFLSSCVIPGLYSSRIVYAFGAVISCVICLLSHTVSGRCSRCVAITVYMSLETYLTYGIFIGVFTRPDHQAVTFMVMLALMSLIFIDRPVYINIVLAVNIAVFCVLAHFYKPADIVSVDILDAIVFGVLSMIVGTIIICGKIEMLVSRYKLRVLSEADQLTGLYNRNRYEGQLRYYSSLFTDSLCCIYIDANGLHELNNTKGHQCGDAMLIAISQAIKVQFGTEDAYRTGGDEFVIFAKNVSQADISEKLKRIRTGLEHLDYHVAIGYAYCAGLDPAMLDLPKLIKTAEARMYDDKKEYYKSVGKPSRACLGV